MTQPTIESLVDRNVRLQDVYLRTQARNAELEQQLEEQRQEHSAKIDIADQRLYVLGKALHEAAASKQQPDEVRVFAQILLRMESEAIRNYA